MDLQDQKAPPTEKLSWNSSHDASENIAQTYAPVATDATVSSEANDASNTSPIEAVEAVEAVADETSTEVEAVAADPVVETVVAPSDLTQRLERLAAHEKRLRLDRQSAQAAAKEANDKIAEINSFNENLQRLKGNPVEAARFLGVDPQALLRAMVGEEPAPKSDEELTREELAELKQWRADTERRAQEAEQARIRAESTASMERIAADAEAGVRAAGDEFELINARGDHRRVFDVQVEYYRAHKTPIDWRTAAQYVEAAIEAETRPLLATKKFSASAQAPAVATKPQTATPPKTQQAIPGSRTLTTRPVQASQAPERVSLDPTSYLDRDDSIDQMAAAFAASRRAR